MRPRDSAAGVGVPREIAGAAVEAGMRPADSYTTVDSGGTVTVRVRSAAVPICAGPLPYTRVNGRPATYVGTAAVRACSLLFNATTYSRCCLRSMREKA